MRYYYFSKKPAVINCGSCKKNYTQTGSQLSALSSKLGVPQKILPLSNVGRRRRECDWHEEKREDKDFD
jgi:hypothetical protein